MPPFKMQDSDLRRIAQKLKQDHLSCDAPPVDIKDLINERYPTDPFELLGENDFGPPRQVSVKEVGSPIQEFFRDGTVLITGGTGFMGKTITEKLIRSCPHLKRIYLLIRSKKNKHPQDRLEDIFQERLFLRLKAEVPDFRSKISVITGDVSLSDLGLNPAHRSLLTESVTVVFHGAATVRFDENIKTAMCINVRGVQAMLQLAKQMKNLKSFVHVSTAFSHCPRKTIDEVFYDAPYDHRNIMQLILSTPNEKMEKFRRVLVEPWPNTYSFTKALAEDVVRKESDALPVAIARPSAIVSTYREPVRGWIDNPYGPVGMVVGGGTGVVHICESSAELPTDLIPIDVVVNTLIAIAWYRGSSSHQSIPIYNIVSSTQNPITVGDFISKAMKTSNKWPAIQAVWYISFILTTNRLLYYFLNFFLHAVPSFVLDGLLVLRGQKPLLSTIYAKLDKAQSTLVYFALRQWCWKNENVQRLWTQLGPTDQAIFFFDMSQLDWDYFCEALSIGLRVNLLKDGLHTLPAARIKWQRLKIAHYVLKFSFFSLVAYVLFVTSCILYHGALNAIPRHSLSS